jgi:hypothetical protein
VQYGDCFGATPNTSRYGHLVYRTPANCPGPDDEYLPSITGAYQHAALIGANMEPNVSGDAPGEIPYASAIFLHRYSFDGNGNSRSTVGLRLGQPHQPAERAAPDAAGRDVRDR